MSAASRLASSLLRTSNRTHSIISPSRSAFNNLRLAPRRVSLVRSYATPASSKPPKDKPFPLLSLLAVLASGSGIFYYLVQSQKGVFRRRRRRPPTLTALYRTYACH